MVLELVRGKLPWENFCFEGKQTLKKNQINQWSVSLSGSGEKIIMSTCSNLGLPGDILELKWPESHMSCRPSRAREWPTGEGLHLGKRLSKCCSSPDHSPWVPPSAKHICSFVTFSQLPILTSYTCLVQEILNQDGSNEYRFIVC